MGRVLKLPPGGHEEVLYAVSYALFHPVLAGVVLVAVLAATMSTVDSQLLVCSSCVTHDLGLPRLRHWLATNGCCGSCGSPCC
ncbi:MAG: hypothetical protein IPK26_25780 [Planctomycetes bacterium]|nr:hypothetical protein [Planctomycetota bacterium]